MDHRTAIANALDGANLVGLVEPHGPLSFYCFWSQEAVFSSATGEIVSSIWTYSAGRASFRTVEPRVQPVQFVYFEALIASRFKRLANRADPDRKGHA